jgi:hypothetical protein
VGGLDKIHKKKTGYNVVDVRRKRSTGLWSFQLFLEFLWQIESHSSCHIWGEMFVLEDGIISLPP